MNDWRKRAHTGHSGSMRVKGALLAVAALIAVAACTPDETSPIETTDGQVSTPPVSQRASGSPYGSARITPATVSPGASLTVTPTAVVERTCGPWGVLYLSQSQGLEELGQLTTTGDLTPMTEATVTPCYEYPSDSAISFVVPTELDPDDYVVCIWRLEDTAGCGTITVSKPVGG
jgi:hypothetical protein